jgi:hypothetical protein
MRAEHAGQLTVIAIDNRPESLLRVRQCCVFLVLQDRDTQALKEPLQARSLAQGTG